MRNHMEVKFLARAQNEAFARKPLVVLKRP